MAGAPNAINMVDKVAHAARIISVSALYTLYMTTSASWRRLRLLNKWFHGPIRPRGADRLR